MNAISEPKLFSCVIIFSKYYIVTIVAVLFSVVGVNAKDITYEVHTKDDGGYRLDIYVTQTEFFTADGFFYKYNDKYIIDLIGKGKDFSYRNQNGYYYELNVILSNIVIDPVNKYSINV